VRKTFAALLLLVAPLAAGTSATARAQGTAPAGAPAASPADAAYSAGLTLMQSKRYAEAAEKFEVTVAADPKHADGWYQLASARRRSERCDRAIVAYRRFLTLSPATPSPHYGLGLCLRDTGDKAGALASLKKYVGLEKDPKAQKWLDHAQSVIAELGAAAGNESAASSSTETAASKDKPAAGGKTAPPSPGAAAYAEAQSLRDRGHIEDSIAKFRQSIAADPKNMLPRVALGELLLKIRRDDEAVEVLRAAVEKGPSNPLAWYDLAFALRAKGRLKEAVDAYEKYIKLRPGDPDPYYGLGRTLQQLGRHADARKAYETYVAMEKNPTEQRWVASAQAQLQALPAK
jgi:tetratricopeptide (TPR) repeat protein